MSSLYIKYLLFSIILCIGTLAYSGNEKNVIYLPIIQYSSQLSDITPTTTPTPTACPSVIAFTSVPPYGSFDDLLGNVMCAEPETHKIAVYIYVSGWWTKPTSQDPLTTINSDGTWTTDITTGGLDHQATKIAAFLVPSNYFPPLIGGAQELPTDLFDNAVAEAMVEREPTRRTLEFSGYTWEVKESELAPVGPGPNYFSNNQEDVWVDGTGRLHMKIVMRDGRWYSTEIINTESLGYGSYSFTLAGPFEQVNENIVLGFFTWDTAAPAFNYREIDIELARWGDPANDNAQYVVQPYTTAGNIFRFDLPANVDSSTHVFTWEADRVHFRTVRGADRNGESIMSWAYTGADIPPAGDEQVRINLWLFRGAPPSDGQETEVVIDAFSFIPIDSSTPTTTSATPVPKFTPTPTATHGPPRIALTVEGNTVHGNVGPASFCNANYKIALYAKTDIWYVQPFDDARGDIQINSDCTWQSSTHAWDQLAAHLAPVNYDHPSTIRKANCPPPPLDPATDSAILAASCTSGEE